MNSPTAQLQNCTRPVDRLAAQGVSPSKRLMTLSECPTLYPGTVKDLQRRTGLVLEDLTGLITQNGTTVVGLVSMDSGFGSTIWAVRCECGKFYTRKGRLLRNIIRKGYTEVCPDCHNKRSAHNAKVSERSAAGAESARLPGYATGDANGKDV